MWQKSITKQSWEKCDRYQYDNNQCDRCQSSNVIDINVTF